MLTNPEPFGEALDTLRRRLPLGSPLNSTQWSRQSVAVRERAFFSARVESVRFLQRVKDFLMDYLERNREVLSNGQFALKADGRARFVRDMARFAIAEGMGPPGVPYWAVNPSDLTDIRSEARLQLIFETQVKQAFGFGYWTQGMEPEILDAYPAARFVRHPGAKDKRPRHAAHEGEVRLKNDFDWWAFYQNDIAIGGFGVPWPPYGFHSKMDQEDVTRADAEALGVLKPGQAIKSKRGPGINEGLKASVRGLDPELRSRLEAELGVKAKGDEIRPDTTQTADPGE